MAHTLLGLELPQGAPRITQILGLRWEGAGVSSSLSQGRPLTRTSVGTESKPGLRHEDPTRGPRRGSEVTALGKGVDTSSPAWGRAPCEEDTQARKGTGEETMVVSEAPRGQNGETFQNKSKLLRTSH